MSRLPRNLSDRSPIGPAPTLRLAVGGRAAVALDDDWAVRCLLPGTRRAWRRHRRIHPALADLATVGEAVAVVRSGDQDRSVAVTWALLDLSAAGEELATRALLQVIVPAMVGEMGGWLADLHRRPVRGGRPELTLAEVEQLVLAEAVQAIADTARGRRNRWPVATITRRLHRLLVHGVRHQRAWSAHNTLRSDGEADGLDPTGDGEAVPANGSRPLGAADELSGAVSAGVAQGTISAFDGRLVWLTRVAGYHPAEVAEATGLSADTLRRRRHRAERRLAGAGSA